MLSGSLWGPSVPELLVLGLSYAPSRNSARHVGKDRSDLVSNG
jgi:hypothetical protein